MKKNLLKFLLLVGFIFLPFFTPKIFACQCHGLPTPYQAYEDATTVFVGKVISVKDVSGKEIAEDKAFSSIDSWREHYGETRYYRLEIQESLKGTKAPELEVSIGINMRQFGLDKGETYLIYAYEYKSSKGKFLTTHLFCSRNGDLKTAQDDVHFLRALLKNKPEPRIYGSVQKYDKDTEANSRKYTYLEGIKIIAESKNKKFKTVTDKNGLYSFDELPDGNYKVYPELSNRYVLEWWYNLDEINLVSDDSSFDSDTDFTNFTGHNAYSEFRVSLKN